MSFLSKPSTTSILLAIIAFLLLVQIIQTAEQKPQNTQVNPHMSSLSNPHGMSNPHAQMTPSASNPHAGDAQEEFDPAMMVLASLKCPTDKLLTLDAPTCRGGDTEKRRSFVRKLMEVDRPFREVFDTIVAEYGEMALTDQAAQIRRSMRKQQ